MPEYGRYDDATVRLKEYAWMDDNYVYSDIDVHLTADDIWMPQERWDDYISYLAGKHKVAEVKSEPEVELEDEDIFEIKQRLSAISKRLDDLIAKIENPQKVQKEILRAGSITITRIPSENITLT
jgi:tetrahydromethanopterin S-methyltransferase subunit G